MLHVGIVIIPYRIACGSVLFVFAALEEMNNIIAGLEYLICVKEHVPLALCAIER